MTGREWQLRSNTDFDAVTMVALWTGQVALFAIVAIVVFVMLSRARSTFTKIRIARVTKSLRPLLAEAALVGHRQSSVSVPKILRQDRQVFLHEWNAMHESLLGDAQERLNAFGRAVGLDRIAWQWLHHRKLSTRLLATATLGHLRCARAWDPLLERLDSEESLLSLMAARALAQIDPQRAMPIIITRFLAREDWTVGRVASILTRAGHKAVVGPLLDALAAATPTEAIVLLNFVRVIPGAGTEDAIRVLLQKSTNADLIAACLKNSCSPRLLPRARQLTRHEQWHVRLHAIEFLGRVGSGRDLKYIIRALQDREWWVRYRAAQALCRLPWINLEKLRYIQGRCKDPFARDILEHVIAEAKLA